jgi:O-antigen/teichoic acid export membrane protein
MSRKTKFITVALIGILVSLGLSLTLGWQYSIIGVGTGFGAWIGAHYGNKSARETDRYREQWLAKRAGQGGQTSPRPEEED